MGFKHVENKPRVSGSDGGAANDVGHFEELFLPLPIEQNGQVQKTNLVIVVNLVFLPFQSAVTVFVVDREFSGFVFELLQFPQLGKPGEFLDLIVERQMRHRRVDGLSGFGADANDLENRVTRLLLDLFKFL